MKKVYRMTGIVAAAFFAVSCLLPCLPVSAEETGTQALTETGSSAAVPQGMVLGAAAAGGMTVDGKDLKIYVAVQALPGAAGLDHINIQFRNLDNDRSVTKILRDKDYSNGVYAGWITMSIYEPAGNYVLDKVILQDNNGEYLKYCRAEDREENDKYQTLPFTAGFTVTNGVTAVDETAPVLGAVAVSPVQAAKESQIMVTAAVADDFSGVDTVAVRFENENGKAVSINLEYQGDMLYSGAIKKSQTKEAGTYRIKRVSVADNMGNSKVYNGGDGPFASDVFFVIQ